MFNFSNFFRSLFGFSRSEKIKGLKFSFKYLLIKSILLLFVLGLIICNHLFFLLDELFLFVYRFTPIKRPIMIIGAPRTGTTLLFRTLAEDKDKFTCFTMAELIFAPSLIQKYLFYGIYR
jgi:omega-hydroxy-beta-dihydromenaquinone-9 sulfotransferase